MKKEYYGTEPPNGESGWMFEGAGKWTREERPDDKPAPPQKDGPKIAVVGGGPGGLFTAYIINQRLPDANVTIFEANECVGGKICTDEFSDGTPFEAGVAELYEYLDPDRGAGPDPLRALIEDDLGLKTVNISGGAVVMDGKMIRDHDELEKEYGYDTRKRVEMLYQKAADLMPLEKYAHRWQPDNDHPWAKDVFKKFLDDELGDDCAAHLYVETAVASDLATESHTCNGLNAIKNMLMDNDKYMQVYHVAGGIERVVVELMKRIEAQVKTCTRVTRIGRSRDAALAFNPNEPRAPEGTPGGGEWVKGGANPSKTGAPGGQPKKAKKAKEPPKPSDDYPNAPIPPPEPLQTTPPEEVHKLLQVESQTRSPAAIEAVKRHGPVVGVSTQDGYIMRMHDNLPTSEHGFPLRHSDSGSVFQDQKKVVDAHKADKTIFGGRAISGITTIESPDGEVLVTGGWMDWSEENFPKDYTKLSKQQRATLEVEEQKRYGYAKMFKYYKERQHPPYLSIGEGDPPDIVSAPEIMSPEVASPGVREKPGTEMYVVHSLDIGEDTLTEQAEGFDAVVVALPNHWLRTIKWEGPTLACAIHEIVAHYDLPAHYLRASMLFSKKWWADLEIPGEFWMMDMLNGCCCYDDSTRWGRKPKHHSEEQERGEDGKFLSAEGEEESGGHVLSFLLAGGDALLMCSSNQSDECILDYVLQSMPPFMRELAEDHYVEGQVDRYVGSINAQPGGWPAEELRGEHTPEPSEHPGLFLVGDYFFDSTLNAALMSANTAVELLVEHLGVKSAEVTEAVEALESNDVGV